MPPPMKAVPPGFKTRRISLKARTLSGQKMYEPRLTISWAKLSGKGIFWTSAVTALTRPFEIVVLDVAPGDFRGLGVDIQGVDLEVGCFGQFNGQVSRPRTGVHANALGDSVILFDLAGEQGINRLEKGSCDFIEGFGIVAHICLPGSGGCRQ